MSNASTVEQEMLALINQERTSRGLDPLQLETQLNDSAEDHSAWMLDRDVFSHTGDGGSSSFDRMQEAGFDFTGSWRSGENIAWQSERGEPGISDDVEDLHESLMNSPGHRANILNPDFKYIGIGIETGDMQGYDAIMVTQNFAKTDAEVLLDIPSETDPTPEPETPVADNPDTDEPVADEPDTDVTDTEEPDTDVTDTDDPDTEEPDTDVTDTDDPDTEEPDTDVTDTDDPDTEEPDTDVTDTDDAETPDVDAILASVSEFLDDVLEFVDQFDFGEPGSPAADFGDFAVGLVGLWITTEVLDGVFDQFDEPETPAIAADDTDTTDSPFMQFDMDGCMFDFA